jgi:MFS family permease
MATHDQEGEDALTPSSVAIPLRRLSLGQILAISIFYFALNFHWAALGLIVLPSQVFKMVGELHKGEALAFVLVPGAFVSLFANPLFGLLSDRTRGKLAVWGRRRPYILLGTVVNVGALVWMALSPDIVSLALAFVLVQFSSNAAQAPFHALLPDVVSVEQRGITSGIMGMLLLLGNIAGVVLAGMFIDANLPLPIYQLRLWLMYGLICVVLLLFMCITIFTVREPGQTSDHDVEQEADLSADNPHPRVVKRVSGGVADGSEQWGAFRLMGWRMPGWLTRDLAMTVGGTVLAVAVAWGLMALWNATRLGGISINDGVQQVVLEVIATIGLLRMFDFNPRRDPDFAWVLLTRLLMMLGIYTIQTFLQYYMRDAVGAAHPEQETTKFIILVSLTSLVSSLFAGWLSDRFGRKLMVYISGCCMALVGLVFIVTHDLLLVILAGGIFGIGYGAYTSVDWALVADVLPDRRNFARDMGIWNIALSLPQVVAPVLGGPLIDLFVRKGQPVVGYQVLFALAIVYCLVGTYLVRYIRGVKGLRGKKLS